MNITIPTQIQNAVCDISADCTREAMRLVRDQFYWKNNLFLIATVFFIINTIILARMKIKNKDIEFILEISYYAFMCYMMFWSLYLLFS